MVVEITYLRNNNREIFKINRVLMNSSDQKFVTCTGTLLKSDIATMGYKQLWIVSGPGFSYKILHGYELKDLFDSE